MKVLLFGGTTEGRLLVDFLQANNIQATVCVTSDHGSSMLDQYKKVNIIIKRQDINDIELLIQDHDIIIDATHPYASIVTENIIKANEKQNKTYYRVVREFFELDNALIFNSMENVVTYLNEHEGNVLVTTGSKVLKPYTSINNYQTRLYFRVLPMLESIQACIEHKISLDHIIALQGPFSSNLNKAMLQEYKCEYMISKNTGKSGGLQEKIASAQELGVKLLIIEGKNEQGYTIEQLQEILKTKE